MKNTERFDKILSFSKDTDRTPVIEWAGWWDKTIDNWREQGLPKSAKNNEDIKDFFGQDKLRQFWLPIREGACPRAKSHGAPVILNEQDYKNIKKYLYTDKLLVEIKKNIKKFAAENSKEDYAYW